MVKALLKRGGSFRISPQLAPQTAGCRLSLFGYLHEVVGLAPAMQNA
jgi:hypothetical protein